MKLAISMIASKKINVIEVILALTTLILLMPISNSLFQLFGIDVEKNLILVHDDLDIKIGKFKMQYDRAPQGHNGVKDVEDRLKTKEFLRVRIGIESRIDKCISGEDFVLMKFTEDEQMVLNEVIEDSVTALLPEILL